MKASNVDRALMVAGALAVLAGIPLALVVARNLSTASFPSDLIAAILFVLAGAFAVWRRPENLATHRLLLAGVCDLAANVLERALSLAALFGGALPWFWVANALDQALQIAAMSAWVGLCAVFPDGAYQRRYERWIVRASWALVPLIPALLLLTLPTLYINEYVIWAGTNAGSPSPLFVPALAALGPLARGLWDGPVFLLSLVGAGLLMLRYRRFGHEQRLQLLWPLLAALAFGLALLVAVLSAFGLVPETMPVILFHATVLLLPITIAIGLLRHRLFDVEVVLRRSLIYGALWLAITLGSVGLTAVLGIAAGRFLPTSIVVLLTIVATLLLQPARRRMERLADRLVFGVRLSGPELLARVGATLEHAFALDELAPHITALVAGGLDAAWVRLSLWSHAEGSRVAEPISSIGVDSGTSVEPVLAAPLVYAGGELGMIECGPKCEGAYDQHDAQLLATIGRQTALAIHNIRLAGELAERLDVIERQARDLAASRARIVQAGDAERRRIERDLHDGLQQQLVALIARLRLARNQLARDASQAERTLAEIQDDTRQALDDLRELARGIHPPLLSDRGLLDAIEARLARLPINVMLEGDSVARGTRYASEIEVAAYFFVCECLANVVKHASAQQATIHLAMANGDLRIEVADDGCGFDPGVTVQTGLRGLRDRIEALGGQVWIASQPAAGTTLSASIPLQERAHA